MPHGKGWNSSSRGMCFVGFGFFFFPPFSLGLFEVRALEYLESIPETEPSGMNKILRSLGKGTPLLMCVCVGSVCMFF